MQAIIRARAPIAAVKAKFRGSQLKSEVESRMSCNKARLALTSETRARRRHSVELSGHIDMVLHLLRICQGTEPGPTTGPLSVDLSGPRCQSGSVNVSRFNRGSSRTEYSVACGEASIKHRQLYIQYVLVPKQFIRHKATAAVWCP